MNGLLKAIGLAQQNSSNVISSSGTPGGPASIGANSTGNYYNGMYIPPGAYIDHATMQIVYPTQAARNSFAGTVGGGGGGGAYVTTTDPIENDTFRRRAVGTRLRLRDGERFPFDFFETALGDDKVFVFLMKDNKPVVLEDDRALFPSDTLVAQLHLLIG